jgi:hypothetical protein
MTGRRVKAARTGRSKNINGRPDDHWFRGCEIPKYAIRRMVDDFQSKRKGRRTEYVWKPREKRKVSSTIEMI